MLVKAAVGALMASILVIPLAVTDGEATRNVNPSAEGGVVFGPDGAFYFIDGGGSPGVCITSDLRGLQCTSNGRKG